MNGTIISAADIAIIGAGMAGASLAAEIGDAARVILIEGEAQPGYHSTGRSAAFWSEMMFFEIKEFSSDLHTGQVEEVPHRLHLDAGEGTMQSDE